MAEEKGEMEFNTTPLEEINKPDNCVFVKEPLVTDQEAYEMEQEAKRMEEEQKELVSFLLFAVHSVIFKTFCDFFVMLSSKITSNCRHVGCIIVL